MIVITDEAAAQPPCWKVVNLTDNTEIAKINYDPNDLTGYDRVRVLRQIVDFQAMMGFTQGRWKIDGSVFIVQKPSEN